MKSLSIKVNRSSRGGHYAKRTKGNKTKSLNITSLIDILTILLVFMLKNISMDSTQRESPKGMLLPTTITKNDLIKTGRAVILRVYPDKILYGKENQSVGTMEEFMTDISARETLLGLLQYEAKNIQGRGNTPCLLIQADKELYCQYITEIIKFSARSSFANIFFSTIHTDDKTQVLGLQ